MLGYTIFAQKKDAHQRKIPPDMRPHLLYIKPKDLISNYYLAGHFAAATAAWILSSILLFGKKRKKQ